MKTEEFSNALNNVNDKYIEEAANFQTETEMVTTLPFDSQKEEKKTRKTMKIWRGIAIAACAVLVAGIGLVAIVANISMGGASKDAAYEYASDDYAYNESAGASAAPGVGYYVEEKSGDIAMGGVPEALANNKIIYSAYISMETKEFEKAASDLEQLVNSMGGYFEWAEVNNNSSDYRYGSYTIRIPAERLNEFLDQAGSLCTVKSSHKSAEDVSESYYDTESRLETAQTKLKRLQELLAQAATMEDIIELEREISDTELLIDSYTGTLKQYDSLIDYAKVNIDLREVYRDSSVNQPLTFGQRLADSFKGGLKGFGWFLENLLVWFASSWIWLLIIAAIVVIAVIVIKKKVNKKKNNKNIQQ